MFILTFKTKTNPNVKSPYRTYRKEELYIHQHYFDARFLLLLFSECTLEFYRAIAIPFANVELFIGHNIFHYYLFQLHKNMRYVIAMDFFIIHSSLYSNKGQNKIELWPAAK